MFKERIIFIVCLCVILTFVNSEKYVCADELKQGGVCRLSSKDSDGETITYVKKCGKGKSCEEADENTLGGCVKDQTKDLGDENDKCKVNEECLSQNCVNGKCKYLEDGAKCENSNVCKPTSYCSSSTDKCRPISKGGEVCISGEESCLNGYICGKTSESDDQSKCIEKYSIDDGNYASSPKLCLSGQLSNKKCISYTLQSEVCSNNNKCSYKTASGSIEELSGYCVTKSDGKTKACRQLNGELWNKYVKLYKKELKDIKGDKDFNRHSSKWGQFFGKGDISDAYVEWWKNVLLSDADNKCVRKFILQSFGLSNFISFNLIIIIGFALIAL